MARAAPVALIFRRGPGRWVQLIEWQTQRDAFTDGAWFRGRVYAEKCDLSPDGRLLLYFCHQGRKLLSSYSDSWTAVSRTPWLHALALWPSGTTYGGGGRFLSDRKLALRTGMPLITHPDHPARGLEAINGTGAELALHESAGLVEGAEWSGHDHRGHVVFCAGGKLFRRAKGRDIELADFNDRVPDPGPAPDWARRLL